MDEKPANPARVQRFVIAPPGQLKRYVASLMKLSLVIIFLVLLVAPNTFAPDNKLAAQRAWKPFFTAFRGAVKKHDRVALRRMMSSDFFSSGGNSEGPEAAFQFWDDSSVRGWQAFNRILARGTVSKGTWWDAGRKGKYISRVSPPAANIRRNIKRGSVDWYAIFEFRDGRWYCTIFNQCCD